jgi:hypothetical protein
MMATVKFLKSLLYWELCKKSLKILKGSSETVKQRRTYNENEQQIKDRQYNFQKKKDKQWSTNYFTEKKTDKHKDY